MTRPKIEIKHEPSVDDAGDWIVYINGERQLRTFWSEDDAQKAVDGYLWKESVRLWVDP